MTKESGQFETTKIDSTEDLTQKNFNKVDSAKKFVDISKFSINENSNNGG